MSFSFFCPFFKNLVRYSKPQNIEIQFLCEVVELQTQFFLSEKFWGDFPKNPSKQGPKKLTFLMAQARVLVFFLYQQILNRLIF